MMKTKFGCRAVAFLLLIGVVAAPVLQKQARLRRRIRRGFLALQSMAAVTTDSIERKGRRGKLLLLSS